jgi:hypothetical protein
VFFSHVLGSVAISSERPHIDIFILTRQEMVPDYISKTHSTITAIVLSALPLLYIVVKKVLHRLSAPIRQLPGPKSVNWLTGSLERHVWEPDAQDAQLDWIEKYGHVFRYYGMFNVSVPHVTDSNKSDNSIFPDGQDRYYGSPSVELYL